MVNFDERLIATDWGLMQGICLKLDCHVIDMSSFVPNMVDKLIEYHNIVSYGTIEAIEMLLEWDSAQQLRYNNLLFEKDVADDVIYHYQKFFSLQIGESFKFNSYVVYKTILNRDKRFRPDEDLYIFKW